MAIINFGPWLPDRPSFQNSCITATNVRPVTNGYAPFNGFGTALSDALAGVIGVLSFKRVNGTIEHFAGTATKLYRLVAGVWTDVSRATPAYSAATFWRFAMYGDRLIATNGIDAVQKFDLATDATFSDLNGTPPIHRFPIVIRDFLVAIDVQDGSGFEVKWSANNNSEKWTADCGAGAQDFLDGGPVVGGTGGEIGTILQERGVTRMTFVGGDLRFTFDRIEGAVGCIAPDSIVELKGNTFYLSNEGFQLFDGVTSKNISDEAVSDFFFGLLDSANVLQVRGALDQRNSSVIWSYPTSTTPRLIGYNYALGRWFEANLSVPILHTRISSAGDVLAGFDSANKLAALDGVILSATVSTGDLQLAKDNKTFVLNARGLVDAAHDITVGKKNALSDIEATVIGSSNTNGRAPVRSNGRYHRIQLQPTTTWTELVGVDIEAVPSGREN